MNTQASGKILQYDVALSFAGEDRAYVAQVAELLRERNVRVFYDEFAIAETWGADLYTFLDDVYRKKSRFAAVFVSKHYAAKPWTSHERQSVQARALNELGPYLLPIRLDGTDLPGLRPTTAYVDARRITVERLVELIQEKLGEVPGETLSPPTFARVPCTAEENRRLLAQRPSPWEHLLYAGVLLQRRDALEHKWRDHEIRYARRQDGYLNRKEAIAVLRGATNEGSAIVSGITRVLDPRAQEAAFGAPGEPGDPDRIEHLASSLMAIYEELLDRAARLRGRSVPGELRHVFELAAQLVDKSILGIRAFVDKLVAEMDTVSERLSKGEKVQIDLTLMLEVDEHVSSELSREMDRIVEQLG